MASGSQYYIPFGGTLAQLIVAMPPGSFNYGILASTTDAGLVWNDQTNWNSVYQRISLVTTAIGGSLMALGSTQKTTVTVIGARIGMSCAIAPQTYPGDGVQWQAYVSANDTVVVVISALIAVTPVSTTYSIKVFA